MTTKELEERKAKEREESRKWVAERFKIKLNDVLGYNGGICYDTAWVRTQAAAKKIAKAVKGETANGGWYHGMPLGDINTQPWDDDGKSITAYRVTC